MSKFDQACRELSAMGLYNAETQMKDKVVQAFSSDILLLQKVFCKRAGNQPANRTRKGYKNYVSLMRNLADTNELGVPGAPHRIALVLFKAILNSLSESEAAELEQDDFNPVFQELINSQIISRYLPAFISSEEVLHIPEEDQLQFWVNVILDFIHNTDQQLIELFREPHPTKAAMDYCSLRFKPLAKEFIDGLDEAYSYTLNRPMLCQPADWVSPSQGGYVTRPMQNANKLSRHHAELPKTVLDAINVIQKHSFIVNPQGIQVMELSIASTKQTINKLKRELKAARLALAAFDENVT